MHGNMSGPLIVEGIFNKERLIGPEGDGRYVRMIADSNQVLRDLMTFMLPFVKFKLGEVCSVQSDI